MLNYEWPNLGAEDVGVIGCGQLPMPREVSLAHLGARPPASKNTTARIVTSMARSRRKRRSERPSGASSSTSIWNGCHSGRLPGSPG
jgi:hypothetical protein